MFVSSVEYSSGKILEFSFKAADTPGYENLKKIVDSLVLHQPLNYGGVFSEKGTDNFWYVDPHRSVARHLSREQLDLCLRWNSQSAPLDKSLINLLEKIGGLPSTGFFMQSEFLRFPAKIYTKAGEEIDFCVLHFSKLPPFQKFFKKVLLLSDVDRIVPSEFALDHNLRMHSMLADEVRMGYSPFVVKTTSGERITYNGLTQFASPGKYKGSDIVTHVPFVREDVFEPLLEVPSESITWVTGKWNDSVHELFLQYSKWIEENTPALIHRKPGLTFWERLMNFLAK